jgi:hypothetical protein
LFNQRAPLATDRRLIIQCTADSSDIERIADFSQGSTDEILSKLSARLRAKVSIAGKS